MKAIIISYSEGVNGVVMEFLQNNNVQNYTQWTKVLGKGTGSGPHQMTHIWPKANNVIFCAVDDETAARLVDGVKELRQKFRAQGIKAFQIPIEALT